ncbi:TatD family hydrolase [Shigella flexneri]
MREESDGLRWRTSLFYRGRETAGQLLDLGLHLLFRHCTFRNASHFAMLRVMSPLDRLLVETASPYLAPVPRRGKRINLRSFVTCRIHGCV